MEKWMLCTKKADFAGIGERFGIDQVTARIIRNRDVVEDEDIRLYLRGGIEDLYDPHLLKDVEKLTDILKDKIHQKASVRIIGDYDIDGVMSSYILKSGLERLGCEASVVIPNRIIDGYGLNRNLVLRAKEEGVDTLLTCDNGIAALEEIALAKELGMTVLVTDHHEIPFVLEDGQRREKESRADAVVNPHQSQCLYPNKNLCGAAVAWKMLCVLYEKFGLQKEEAYDFLEMVAFATVGDIMSLQGENRILVKEGLKRIHTTQNLGLRALIAQCGLLPGDIRAYHFGFVLGPCVNASGRLDTAYHALELLLSKEESKAVMLAAELVNMNDQRKTMTLEGTEAAKAEYEKKGYALDKVLVIYLPHVHESIAGIIAGRIREAYNKPTFILTNAAEGVKGSGRSIEGYSMYEKLCQCQDLLSKFGGHPMAAGLSLPVENVEEFRQRLNRDSGLSEEDLQQKILIDVPMPLDYVTIELVRELDILEPYGKDNERPVFADRQIHITGIYLIGKDKNFLRLEVQSASGLRTTMVYFGDKDMFLQFLGERYGEATVQAALSGSGVDMPIAAIYKPDINEYRGQESLRFELRSYC